MRGSHWHAHTTPLACVTNCITSLVERTLARCEGSRTYGRGRRSHVDDERIESGLDFRGMMAECGSGGHPLADTTDFK